MTAFRQLLNDVNNNNRPTTLQTDKGSEFFNLPLQRLLKEYGVPHFATHNEETKESIVERINAAESEVDISGVGRRRRTKLIRRRRMVGIYSVVSVPRKKSCFCVRLSSCTLSSWSASTT